MTMLEVTLLRSDQVICLSQLKRFQKSSCSFNCIKINFEIQTIKIPRSISFANPNFKTAFYKNLDIVLVLLEFQ